MQQVQTVPHKHNQGGGEMVVETISIRDGTYHFDDEAYKDQTPEQTARIIRNYSEFITRCLLQKIKTA